MGDFGRSSLSLALSRRLSLSKTSLPRRGSLSLTAFSLSHVVSPSHVNLFLLLPPRPLIYLPTPHPLARKDDSCTYACIAGFSTRSCGGTSRARPSWTASRMCDSICVCVCARACTHACTHACVRACVFCVCVFVVSVCVSVCVCVCMRASVFFS